MNDKEKKCDYCEADAVCIIGTADLCADCAKVYENKTGYCSLECCITGRCDGSC